MHESAALIELLSALVIPLAAVLALVAALARAEDGGPRRLEGAAARPGPEALEDPDDWARLRAARALFRADARPEPAAVALAAGDSHPEIRLLAARFTGAEAWVILSELALDGAVRAGVRRRALLALPSFSPPEVVRRVTLAGLADPNLRVAEAAALLALRLGHPGDDGLEAALVALLERDYTPSRLAAVEALGAVGGVAAAAALSPLSRGARGELRARARLSLRRVQSRLPGGARGALALAAPPGGQLSLPGESGAISCPAEPGDERGPA